MSERWQRELTKLRELTPPEHLWREIESRADHVMPDKAGSALSRFGTVIVGALVGAFAIALAMWAFVARTGGQDVAQIGPSLSGKIAFTSLRDRPSSYFEIYSVDADGTNFRRLTHTGPAVADIAWDWSPDGTRLTFVVYEGDSDRDIYVMNADGTGRMNLTGALDQQGPSNENEPAWSPDGTKIAFVAEWKTISDIYIVNAEGSGLRKVYDGRGLATSPTWAPDGTRIAFSAETEQGGDLAIYTVGMDGTGLKQLTASGSFAEFPAWSPDDDQIAYISDQGGTKSVFVTNTAGTSQPAGVATVPLDSPDCCLGPPLWSPDGTKLAFAALHDGNWDIYVAAADGSEVTHVTRQPGDETWPVWSPDGSKLAFAGSDIPADQGENAGTFDIYVVDPGGGGERRLTTGAQAMGGHIS